MSARAVRVFLLAAWAICTAAPAPAQSNPSDASGGGERFALVCYGEGERPTMAMRSGFEYDDKVHRYVPKTRTEWTTQHYDSVVNVEIDGNAGRIRPADNMVPPLHADSDRGWFSLSDVTVTQDQIRGAFRLNAANRPSLLINRRSGHVSIDGLTKFQGSCDPVESRERRF